MKIQLLLFLFLVAPGIAGADVALNAGDLPALGVNEKMALDNSAGSDTTFFSQIKKYFDSGTGIKNEKEIEGGWTGRCYRSENPNTPIASLLVAKYVTPKADPAENNGPLFPAPSPKTTFNLALLAIKDVAPDKYDNFSKNDEIEVNTYIVSSSFGKLLTLNTGAYLKVENKSGNIVYMIKRTGSYFIGMGSNLADSGQYKAGDLAGACYYFKKVMN